MVLPSGMSVQWATRAVARICAPRGIVLALFVLSGMLTGCDPVPGARQKSREDRWLKGRVFAEVRVREASTLGILPNFASSPAIEFETYRQTQSRILTGPFVLQMAMRNPEVARLEILKRQPDPLAWLEKNLHVDFPAREFMRLSMKSGATGEEATIINAVVNAFLEEAGDSEAKERTKRRNDLEKALEDFHVKQKLKRSRLRKILEMGQSGSPTQVQQAQAKFLRLAVSELAREEFARFRDEIEWELLKKPSSTEELPGPPLEERLPVDGHADDRMRLEATLSERTVRIGKWKDLLERHNVSNTNHAVESIDVRGLEREIEQDQQIIDQIREQITLLELQPQSESRVSLFRRAERPKDGSNQ